MSIKEDKIREQLFRKGIEAFNNQQYYDAHEYWEDLWSNYRLKDAKFIQALIQLSVGYFHISNTNINGAKGLLNKCLLKFDFYKPSTRGLDVDNIINAVQSSLENLDIIENITDFDWKLTPKLNVDNERTV